MNHEALFERILQAVDQRAYLPLADSVDPEQQQAMRRIEQAISDTRSTPADAVALARQLHGEGRIDAVMLWSALHVIAASPRVADYEEAARCVAQQELAALELGGPRLQANLASVERHRGVLAFMKERYDVALDYFSRAFERQRSPGNLANVLSTLIRLGDVDEARSLFRQVRASLPASLVDGLVDMVRRDPDLALLHTELTP